MPRQGNTTDNNGSADIRNFMSPARLTRHRRIVESDSSENNDERDRPVQNALLQAAPIQVGGEENDPPQPEAITQRSPQRDESSHAPQDRIEILDSDSSDSMFVPLRRPLSEINQNGHRDQRLNAQSEHPPTPQRQHPSTPQQQLQSTPQRQHQLTPQQQRQSATKRQHQSSAQKQRQSSPRSQRQSTPQRQRQSSPPRQRRRYDAEAESTSEEDDSQQSADESDQNAAELYRAAIMGVRNRPIAAQQVITHHA